jgi:CHAT domain-containing protein/tetratricopeptide (TPR) repeat protein
VRDDRAENLERAIAAFTGALEVLTKTRFPGRWAEVQNSLGIAYAERMAGDRAENLERSIAAYAAALKVYTKTDHANDWAMVQNNLGIVCQRRIRGDRAENLECAIAAFAAALEVYTKADYANDWAMVQSNLGEVYRNRIRGDRSDNLERAIAAFTAALEVFAHSRFPVRWAGTQNNLGAAYAERIRGDRAENLKRAIAAYQAAIDGAQALGVKEYELRATANLGHLHYDERQWSLAYDAFDATIAALEAMRTESLSEEAKARLIEEYIPVYVRMADSCLRLGRPKEAVEWTEAGKGRLFLEQLRYEAFPVPGLPPERCSLFEKERGMIKELRALENTIRSAPDEAGWRQFAVQRRERWSALDEVWTQLEPYAPDYVALRRGDRPTYEEIQDLVDGLSAAAALVEFCTLPDKIIVFVLRSREQDPTVIEAPVSHDQLLRYLWNYVREVIEYPRRGDVGQRWQELAGPLLAHVMPLLQGADLVYLVPHGLLHLLPLHALQVDGGCLVDRFPLAYAPSAAVLRRVVQRAVEIERIGPQKALVVGNPGQDLRHAEREARRVAEFFGMHPYLAKEATKTAIRSELVGKHLIHLACHGRFRPAQPLQSGIVLADQENLTVEEIMNLSLQADLVTLSACMTGLSKLHKGDELVGLTRALLYAGTRSVLVSLWSVDDKSTEQLMTGFYRRLYDDTGNKIRAKAVALQAAILEMRKTKEHPYYWAPFILVGDWR